MAKVRIREDIWDLGDESDPWRSPGVLAYAKGVGAMRRLAQTDPGHPANWVNQAAIHERQGAKVGGRLENQCQHACWFFLPWHRMYLYRFEQIVRSHLDFAERKDWALPYWNYSDDPGRRVLPPAFRQPQLPNGNPNPLFTPARQSAPININAGQQIPAASVRLKDAMKPAKFARGPSGAVPGFGGGRTNPLFHHGSSGPAGPLEITPHGAVHVDVGGGSGLMSAFGTAALDPIFWLHHANLDRLWEVWLRGTPQRLNPTDTDWLKMSYELVDETGQRVTLKVSECLKIEQQLSYTYSGLPPVAVPLVAEPEEAPLMADEVPPEMIGAIEEPVVLEGAAPAVASLALSAPSRADVAGFTAEGPSAVYLNVEDIEGEANPGFSYGVYVDLPPGEKPDPDSPHYVGLLPFFGIESTEPDDEDEEAPHRLHYVFDITDTVRELSERGQWSADELHVTFAPLVVESESQLEAPPPPLRIGRVSLYVE